jgi:LysM repeat protein
MSAKKESVYIVKQGDNLSTIAERFGVPLVALVIWNRLDPGRPIQPGQRLVIHQQEGGSPAVGEEEQEAESGGSRKE